MSNFQKNSKDYGEPDITYQLAGRAEQRPLVIPMALRIGQAKCWFLNSKETITVGNDGQATLSAPNRGYSIWVLKNIKRYKPLNNLQNIWKY